MTKLSNWKTKVLITQRLNAKTKRKKEPFKGINKEGTAQIASLLRGLSDYDKRKGKYEN